MKDKNHTRSPFSARELAHATKESVAELLLPVAVIVGYFSGFFSLIETAAFTAAYAYVLEVFVRKDYGLKKSAEIALKSIPVAGGVLVIVGAAKASRTSSSTRVFRSCLPTLSYRSSTRSTCFCSC